MCDGSSENGSSHLSMFGDDSSDARIISGFVFLWLAGWRMILIQG